MDISNTTNLQLNGLYQTAEWADFVTVVPLSGPNILKSFKDIGIVLVAEMSSENNLCDDYYKESIIEIAKYHNVSGIITQVGENTDRFLNFTPGVNLEKRGDGNGQKYRDINDAIVRDNCDIIIVGRGIYESTNPVSEIKKYKQKGWEAYISKNHDI